MPRVRKSDAIVRYGRISKEGSPYLRAAVVLAATAVVEKNRRWRTVYNNLSRRSGKPTDRVAVTRRLLTVVFNVLNRNDPYQEDYQQNEHSDRGA
jgi:transposase